MRSRTRVRRIAWGWPATAIAVACLAAEAPVRSPQEAAPSPAAGTFSLPGSEELSYRAEWRLIHAGNARLSWSAAPESGGWRVGLKLESVGLVSRLYRVNNEYTAALDAGLCVTSSVLKAREGRKRRETLVTFDAVRGKAAYLERDLVSNSVVGAHEIDIPGCAHDVIGGLYRLRAMRLEPGQAAQLPISDGKKSVLARVEAQERETLKIAGISYPTIRYEAFLFNNILYRRRGRLFVWLTDDARRLPVQLRVRLPFYIGTVTLELVPEQKARAGGSTGKESE